MSRTLTRRIAFIEQFDLLVGVDLGKRKNAAVMIDRQARLVGRYQFAHQREAYERFVSWLLQPRPGLEQARVLVAMEPTNDYWQWLAGYLNDCGLSYRLVNPFTVKKSREGTQLDYAKDDWRDAATIAQLLRNGQFTETQMQRGAYAQLREYERAHWRLKRDLGRQKTIFRQYVERLFPELSQVFKDLTALTASALLKRHAQPTVITALSWESFVEGVRADFSGKRLMVEKLRQVYQIAPVSIGIQDGEAAQRLIYQQLAAITLIQWQIEELEEVLLEQFLQLPTAPYLLSLGLGPVSTALIAAELGDPRHFRNANQIVKLAGIQPTPKQSGQIERSRTPMSHKGRPRLRTYLFFASLRLIRWDEAFATSHKRYVSRKQRPLKPLEALGVMMNKLLRLFWALSNNRTFYDPQLLLDSRPSA